MENCLKDLKYAFLGHKEIHSCVLQDIGPLGPLPCSHSTSSADHSKQGIRYRWPCAILWWLVKYALECIVSWLRRFKIWPHLTLQVAALVIMLKKWRPYRQLLSNAVTSSPTCPNCLICRSNLHCRLGSPPPLLPVRKAQMSNTGRWRISPSRHYHGA